MPVICWGNLAKSADDVQKIEQSMQDYVENHNENENAHQVYGSSLYMHRFEALLDHKFGSVDFRYLSFTKNFFMTSFESIDGWQKTAGFTSLILSAKLQTTNVTNNEQYAYADLTPDSSPAPFALDFSKNPFFQTSLYFLEATNQTAYFSIGEQVGMDEGDSFGFKVTNGNLYAFVRDGSTYYATQITGITLTDLNIYRAEMDSDGSSIKFSVNGVLKHTETAHLPSGTSNYFFTYYIKTAADAVKNIRIVDLFVQQDK